MYGERKKNQPSLYQLHRRPPQLRALRWPPAKMQRGLADLWSSAAAFTVSRLLVVAGGLEEPSLRRASPPSSSAPGGALAAPRLLLARRGRWSLACASSSVVGGGLVELSLHRASSSLARLSAAVWRSRPCTAAPPGCCGDLFS
jgi:hypothetical protein